MSNPAITDLHLHVEMFRLQDTLNTVIYPNWRDRNFPWRRAIWLECAELAEGLGWKWWKAKPEVTPGLMEQAKMEIIDIWHFVMSELMARDSAEAAADRLAADGGLPRGEPAKWALDMPVEVLVAAAEKLANAATTGPGTRLVSDFWYLAGLAGMNTQAIYAVYVPKNVLNLFRQAHGYKTGGYRKIWGGREDNEHLTELWAELPPASRTVGGLTAALEARYAATA
jgi:dimeric dUTPase (all-alpha-NTP-PPase superfamily)